MKSFLKEVCIAAFSFLSINLCVAQITVGPSGTGVSWDWTSRTMEQYSPDGGVSQVLRFRNSMSQGTGNPNGGFDFAWHDGVSVLRIVNGNVGIGTTSPDNKLTVKGIIHTQEVKVDLSGSIAPDYVFQANYNLFPILELERYVKQYSHLPEVPPASVMERDGVNLKEMNLLLLKKVEELTLYLIEVKKENVIQQEQILELKQTLEELQRATK
jgi:hypothetical protein